MNRERTVFSQLTDLVSRYKFNRCVKRYSQDTETGRWGEDAWDSSNRGQDSPTSASRSTERHSHEPRYTEANAHSSGTILAAGATATQPEIPP